MTKVKKEIRKEKLIKTLKEILKRNNVQIRNLELYVKTNYYELNKEKENSKNLKELRNNI